jgi:Flp pilus assembly protein TadG
MPRKDARLAVQLIYSSCRSGEEGTIIVMVALLLTVIVGLVGLGIDAGQLYVTKQKAQAAADAAVQAGVMDMYNGTTATGTYGTKTTCTTTSGWTPCYYARANGFGGSASDALTVDFSPSGTCTPPAGLGTLSNESPNLICVTVQRTVNTTLMRALGVNMSTVSATAKAALVTGPAPFPIVVTHPTLQDALQANGGTLIKITGGPSRALQVNSTGTIAANGHTANTPEAFSIGNNASVDLSTAGPSGTGADFRSWGPAASNDTTSSISYGSGTCAVWLCLGSSGHYSQPASMIGDPFANLTQPSQPAATITPSPAVIANGNSLGVSGCAAKCAAAGGCQVYQPGTYTGGISVSGSNLLTAYFYPGLYYIVDSGTKKNNVGFTTGANGDMEMLSSVCPNVVNASSSDFSGGGMVVFNHGSSAFNVGSNGSANLIGANWASTNYEGILFWEDRTLTTGVAHAFGGGGQLTLKGTIYANMPTPTYSNYQSVTIKGNSGSNTQITGEIITNVLLLTGGGTINMQLSTAQLRNTRQVALVQ